MLAIIYAKRKPVVNSNEKERKHPEQILTAPCPYCDPILILQVCTFYKSFQSQRARELESNLELTRAVSTAFDSFILNVS
jgi:hypothetical protein